MVTNKPRRLGSFAPLSAHAYKDDALAKAGEAAELLYYRSLSFAADVLQDGFISDTQLDRFPGVGMRDVKKRAERLCMVGLWVREDGGYRIVKWLKWNRSKSEIESLQRKDAARKAPPPTDPGGGGIDPGSDSERSPNGIQTDSDSGSQPGPGGFQPRARNTHTHTDTHTEPTPDTEPSPTRAALFERFYDAYPRKVGKKDAERKFDKALKDGADPEDIITAAQRYASSRRGQDPKFTKHPATWLHQGCWMDEDAPMLQLVSGGYQPYTDPDPSDYYEDL